MEKKILVAITGAVSAYIQQEEMSRTAAEHGSSAWRRRGQRESMNTRFNFSNLSRSHFRKGRWKYIRMEQALAARTNWRIRKSSR